MQPPFIIAIAGLSAAGKSTLAADVAKLTSAPVIKMDDYYRDIEEWGHGHEVDEFNWDRLEMFHLDELASDLGLLKAGRLDTVPSYDFTVSRRTGRNPVPHCGTIVFEGQFALAHEQIRQTADLCVFVDLEIEEAKERRIARDQALRGRTRESIVNQWQNHVLPAWELVVGPSQRFACVTVVGSHDRESNANRVLSAVRQAPAFLA